MQEKTIKILPDNIANKIAAGEVVQRPESVVKELMENSLDANAKNIDVIIKRAGKVLIQVVDDGTGMSEEDARICLERHATSKISSYEDLEEIKTFGFRGEALSSIAAVSIFELKTERAGDEIGTHIKVEEDSKVTSKKGSFAKGTSISVKNLFYNTPARRNFLKSNATELKHIIEAFKRISLANPEINFKLWNEDDLIFHFPAGNQEERVKQVFADNILDAVIEVKEITDYISLTGYVAKPTYLRKSKGDQYLFINKRYVLSKSINHAIFTAFENILEKGDYPFFALFLEIDPSKADFNVHPSKLEVKFEDEKDVYSFVKAVIKKTIGSFDLVPSMAFDTKDNNKLRFTDFKKVNKGDFSDRPNFQRPEKKGKEIFSEEEIDLLFSSLNTDIKETAPAHGVEHPFDGQETDEIYHVKAEKESDSITGKESTFIVLLHNKYILSQIKSGLMIIDQHVAHERILYEKALQAFSANIPFSQQLLFSQTLQVDPGDYGLIKELEQYLSKLGFEIKFFSKNTVVVDGVPSDIKVGSEVDTLMEILDEYKKNQREKGIEVRDNLAKSYSCKAAIKTGDKLTETEMRVLVDQLFATSMPYVCPHGRPIIIKIPLDEFDKRFGRT
jgi:DNA mismatch repair protein MutL